ncbi:MAG: hypothetical protein UU14_C0014G0018 [Candidatus Roizmanbacteria bacterium GW2011_GWB1_40_7]|uniref:SpoVT-AbrB domain-containing protein n=3 Tax=Candidatus Roizmaniibacteriota TaxID=1752723 RepID=A0A0G0XBX4_9BACT|nr:MAG: hypothetical protein UT85_C0009G0018 [Candidatus Levybacteria bacterium GW2011_GWA2_40_16]KKR71996.1 MAG: hypothetical protein UU14_C0014G0018 [Candidatus Roizmanbacteria bacterium GW2011_GWB1_40_7]KKR93968.1 MAG: hypothetical protein UU41_C0016G0015 [Candidatus Roizmanbacteria bacterium GW2011_GWA1_41_13]KKS22469.1 MAG: hypothetical protein UU78_C0016G0014 [Candidatus Roizmanbacteria bacterium GW2011_GWC2_41_7]
MLLSIPLIHDSLFLIRPVQQTVYKSGSSLVVVVPSEFVEVIGVKTGDLVAVTINYDNGTIRYAFSGAKQLTISGISQKRK